MTSFDSQAGRNVPVEPELSVQQNLADEADVGAAVRGLADLVANVDDLDGVLEQIARLTVASVPGAQGAGVTIMELSEGRGAPTVLAWAVTDVFVREVDHLQYDILFEGPCLSAMQSGRSLVSGSIGSDDRWPRLGGRVARMGVHSALAVPLIIRDVVVGALNIYAYERDTFTEHAVTMAELFGRTAAVTVGNMQALQAAHIRATQLQQALSSRAIIDQAIGLLRGRSGVSAEEAMDRLRRISQAENVKVAIIAEQTVTEAVRRARARTSGK